MSTEAALRAACSVPGISPMAVSYVHLVLWSAGVVFLMLPHLSRGLLSDYKTCGDPQCESLMSRVRAIRDHRGQDCRFLSFRRGDIIFVYHKLTGRRQDLWAGSIDKNFGYFPKNAVKEEAVFATAERVMETQKYDFFCMDENGYPIDSSHLDDEDDNNQENPNLNSEIPQPSSGTNDDNDAESLKDPLSPSQMVHTMQTERDKNGNDYRTGAHENEDSGAGVDAIPAVNKQGGSPSSLSSPSPPSSSSSSSWLGSSVTGWLGLTDEGEVEESTKGEENEEEKKEKEAEDSLTSSLTQWLGLRGEQRFDDATEQEKESEEKSETDDSITSAVTGWLGFGGEKKKIELEDKEGDEDKEKEEESEETFRSRRLALDLNSNQLKAVEEKEMGAFGWLGEGLSSALGFGQTNEESGKTKITGVEEENTIQEVEPSTSRSWLNIEIGNVLGYGKDEEKVDRTVDRGLRKTEEVKALTDPKNVNNRQTQPRPTEERKTELETETREEKSKMEPIEERTEEEKDAEPSKEKRENEDGAETKTAGVVRKSIDEHIPSSGPNRDTVESDVVESQKNQNSPSETERVLDATVPVDVDGNDSDVFSILEDSKDSVLTLGTGSEAVDLNEANTQTKSDAESQSVFSMERFSAMLDSYLQTDDGDDDDDDDGNNYDDDKDTDPADWYRTLKSEGEVDQHSAHNSTWNKDKDKDVREGQSKQRDTEDEERSSTSINEVDRDSITPVDISQYYYPLNPVYPPSDHVTSMDNSVSEFQEDGKDRAEHKGATDPKETPLENQSDTTKDLNLVSVETVAVGGNNDDDGDAEKQKEIEILSTDTQPTGTADDLSFAKTRPEEQTQRDLADRDGEDNSESSLPLFPSGTVEAGERRIDESDSIKPCDVGNTDSRDMLDEDIMEAEEGLSQEMMEQEVVTTSEEWAEEGEVNQPGFEIHTSNIPDQDTDIEIIDPSSMSPQMLEKAADGDAGSFKLANFEKEPKTLAKSGETETSSFEKETLNESAETEEEKETDLLQSTNLQSKTPDENDIGTLKSTTMEKGADPQDGLEPAFYETATEMEESHHESSPKEEEWENNNEGEEKEGKEREDDGMESLDKKMVAAENWSLAVDSNREVPATESLKQNQTAVDGYEPDGSDQREERDHLNSGAKLTEEKGTAIRSDVINDKVQTLADVRDESQWTVGVMEGETEENTRDEKKTKEVEQREREEEEKSSTEGSDGERDHFITRANIAEERGIEIGRSDVMDDKVQTPADGREQSQRTVAVMEENSRDKEKTKEVGQWERLETEKNSNEGRDERRKEQGQRKYSQSEETESEDTESKPLLDHSGQSQSFSQLASSDEQIQKELSDAEIVEQKDGELSFSGDISSVDLSISMVPSQMDKAECRDNELESLGDTSPADLPTNIVHGQTERVEDRDKDQLYSGESNSLGLSANKMAEKMHSNHKIVVTEQGIASEREDKKRDLQFEDLSANEGGDTLTMDNGDSNESHSKTEIEGNVTASHGEALGSRDIISELTLSNNSSDPASSTMTSEVQNKSPVMTESRGPFSLFKNAFDSFSPVPSTETRDSGESESGLDKRLEETSQLHESMTPEQDMDSIIDSIPEQVYTQDLHLNNPDSRGQNLPPPSSMHQAASLYHSQNQTPKPEPSLKIKTPPPSKKYKVLALLSHFSVDETAILEELFGQHKLQWLDYTLANSEAMSEEPSHDLAILGDMERQLHHHRETLSRSVDAAQQDEERSRMFVTLQRLDDLLSGRVKDKFSPGNSDIASTDHQGNKHKETASNENLRKTEPYSLGLNNKESKEKQAYPEEPVRGMSDSTISQNQPDSPQQLQGLMKQVLDRVHQTAGGASSQILMVGELLKWLTVQTEEMVFDPRGVGDHRPVVIHDEAIAHVSSYTFPNTLDLEIMVLIKNLC